MHKGICIPVPDVDLVKTISAVNAAFDILSAVLICVVLALSFMRVKSRANVGVRVFAINVMVFDLLSSLSSFLVDYGVANSSFFSGFVSKLGVFGNIFYAEVFRSLAILVSNTSYVPILFMFIMAFLRPYGSLSSSTTKQFVTLVVIADVVPICVQVVNVVLVGPGGTWDTMLFFATTYLLYAVEVVITGVAVWVIYARARELSSVQTNAHSTARKRELVRILCFAIAPAVIQLPFAVWLLVWQIRVYVPFSWWLCQLTGRSIVFTRLITSIKPTVDAISIMVFLGEYRHNVIALFAGMYRYVEDTLVALRFKQVTYVVEPYHVQYTSAILRSTTLSSPSISGAARSNESGRSDPTPVS